MNGSNLHDPYNGALKEYYKERSRNAEILNLLFEIIKNNKLTLNDEQTKMIENYKLENEKRIREYQFKRMI